MIPIHPNPELIEENKFQVIEIDSHSVDRHSHKGYGKLINFNSLLHVLVLNKNLFILNLEIRSDESLKIGASKNLLPLNYYCMCDLYQYFEPVVPMATRYEIYQPVGQYYGSVHAISPYQI